MVLVDTSPAGQGLIEAELPGYDQALNLESYAAWKLRCAFLAEHGPLDPSRPEYKDCSNPLPDDTPAAFRTGWPQFFTADYAADEVSLMSSLYTRKYDGVDHNSLGSLPLVVPVGRGTGPPPGRSTRSFGTPMHEALAHLSSRGVHRFIDGSGHEIQLDKPQAVIDAVDEVLIELHTGKN